MPYAPIVLPADLKTQLYPEMQVLITRDDSTIATEAIDIAINEVKMYLNRFDLVKLFGDANTNTAAIINDPYLKSLVKTIAVWNLLRLANPNADLSIGLTWYEKTVASLKTIQKGTATPDGWPYKETTGETAPKGNYIHGSSNPKKPNHF